MAAIDPPMQERVYRALKAEYLAGRLPGGKRLDLQQIADRHRASKTPVREAAYRLIGEGLFEPNPDGGVRVVHFEAAQLVHLYGWNLHILLSLVHLLKESVLREILDRFSAIGFGEEPATLATATGLIFEAFAEATGNGVATASVRSLNERLQNIRIIEAKLFRDVQKELHLLRNSSVSDLQKAMRRRLERYHARRIDHHVEILAVSASDRSM